MYADISYWESLTNNKTIEAHVKINKIRLLFQKRIICVYKYLPRLQSLSELHKSLYRVQKTFGMGILVDLTER